MERMIRIGTVNQKEGCYMAPGWHGQTCPKNCTLWDSWLRTRSLSLENDSELQGPLCLWSWQGKIMGMGHFFKGLTEKPDKSHSFHGLVIKPFVTLASNFCKTAPVDEKVSLSYLNIYFICGSDHTLQKS